MSAAVRVVQSDSTELLGLGLRRLGLASDRAAALARSRAQAQLLVTGLSGEAVRALRSLERQLPSHAFGEPGRGADAMLFSLQREEAEPLSRLLAGHGPELSALARSLTSALERALGHPAPMAIGKRTFAWGERTFLMGIVNVTPDSFSDGGRYPDADAAVAAGERLAAEGADLLDVGGESTRPGSDPVSVEEELRRVVPVVERLARLVDVPISVDTTKARVVAEAAQAGASLANDVSGFTFDPDLAATCARLGLPACAMHLRGRPRTMQDAPAYDDLVGEVLEGLAASIGLAERAGLPAEKILVDPGIGFGKTAGHNLFLLRNLGQLRALGRPILVGASRKGFIGKVSGRPVGERLGGSLAVLSAAVLAGADIVRVHDVAESRAAAALVDAIAHAEEGGAAIQG